MPESEHQILHNVPQDIAAQGQSSCHNNPETSSAISIPNVGGFTCELGSVTGLSFEPISIKTRDISSNPTFNLVMLARDVPEEILQISLAHFVGLEQLHDAFHLKTKLLWKASSWWLAHKLRKGDLDKRFGSTMPKREITY